MNSESLNKTDESTILDSKEDASPQVGSISGQKDLKPCSVDGKSLVWKFFKKIEDSIDKKTYAHCTINGCQERFVYQSSTTPMIRHLKSVRSQCASKNEKSASKQTNLTSSNFKIQPLSKERAQSITIAIARFLSFDMQAIRIIEGAGFKSSRKLIMEETIPNIYKLSKRGVLKTLKEANYFGLTFDYWSSLSLKSFLTLTIHFCNKDFELKSFLLKTLEVSDAHTGTFTAELIKSILAEYNLLNHDSKFVVVSDSAANMIFTAQELKYPHVACFAHLLHSCIIA